MATRTVNRGYTRPERLDRARIIDSVAVPIDDIDEDVQSIADRIDGVDDDIDAVGSSIRALGRATGAFSAYAASQAVGSNTPFLLLPEVFDVSTWYNPATGRFTPQTAGYYQLSGSASVLTPSGSRAGFRIAKNGATLVQGQTGVSTGQWPVGGAVVAFANGTTDYFQFGAGADLAATTIAFPCFSGFLIGTR